MGKHPDKRQQAPAAGSGGGPVKPAGLRLWIFRLVAAIGVPAVLLVLVEGALRICGAGESMSFTRAERVGDVQCRVPNPAFGWRFFPKSIAREAAWFAYPEEKSPQTIRVFILGGSAAQGDPEPAFGLARMLRVMLEERYPDRTFEVVNAAMTAINSHVVREVVSDVVDDGADMLLLYMGNNEVVGPYGAGNPLVPMVESMPLIRSSLWAKQTRLGQVAGTSIRALMPRTGNAVADWKGMQMFLDHAVAQDSPELQTVHAHFRANLVAALDMARSHQVPAVVATVGVNLRDCAPFGSAHGDGLAATVRDEWQRRYAEAVAKQQAGDYLAALNGYARAGELDDRHAELHYRVGKCLLAMNRQDEAVERFGLARDLDTLRFRADSAINRIIREVVAEASGAVSLVDAEAVFGEQSPVVGLPGREFFFEHVHFNFHGTYVLAKAFLGQVEAALEGKLGEPASGLPDEQRCAERLGYTPFDEYMVLQLVQGRLSSPPFTNQCDIDEQRARLKQRDQMLVDELKQGGIARCRAIYTEAVKQAPDDAWLHMGHGYFLLDGAGDAEAAVGAFDQARGLGLETASLWLGKGMARYRQGRIGDAVAAFRRGLEIQPRNWRLHSQLGFALNQQGDGDEGIEHGRLAAEIAPDVAEVHSNLGLVLMDNRRHDEALRCFERAIELAGESATHLVNMGMALAVKGSTRQAMELYLKALEVDPMDFRANREMARLVIGSNMPAALHHLERAHQARTADVGIANDLAWLLATIPVEGLRDGRRALDLASRVCVASDHRDPALLDTLAAAYAETGNFERAVAMAQRAVSLSRDVGLRQQIESRLAIYRQGRPFREGQNNE